MDDVRKALDNEIIAHIKNLSQMTDGCEVKSSSIDDLSELYKLRIQEIELENQLEVKRLEIEAKKLENAEQNKRQDVELKSKKIENILEIVVAGTKIVLPLIFYGRWMNRGLQFETSGVFKSTTFKNLIHFFKPVG